MYVLITHDTDDCGLQGYGMTEIRQVLDNVIFMYHFYGHTGGPFKQVLDYNGITQSIKIKELEFDKNGHLPEGCMIILEKNNGQVSIEVIDNQIINKLTKQNWRI
jgi:hypothetical protein